jgi:hypothetical protein
MVRNSSRRFRITATIHGVTHAPAGKAHIGATGLAAPGRM